MALIQHTVCFLSGATTYWRQELKKRLIVVSTLALVLGACGGGGGANNETSSGAGDLNQTPVPGGAPSVPSNGAGPSVETNPVANQESGQNQNTTAPSDTSTANPGPTPTPIVLATTIDNDTMSFISALGTGHSRKIVTQASLDLALESVSANQGSSPTYKITFSNGSIPNGLFLSNLALPPAEGYAASFEQDFGAYKPTQYNALLVPTSKPNTAYGVSIQSLVQNGFAHVSMGSWKYFGPYQDGYFSGYKMALGSFLIGSPTESTAVGSISSATYSGYGQAGIEATPYDDNFDELRSNVSVVYDKASSTVTIQLSDLQYWAAAYMSIGDASKFTQYAGLHLPANLGCTAQVAPNTNTFSCEMDPNSTGYSATFKGKFFGPAGTEIAGTFAVKGLFLSDFYAASVGAFAAKSN